MLVTLKVELHEDMDMNLLVDTYLAEISYTALVKKLMQAEMMKLDSHSMYEKSDIDLHKRTSR